jgi:flavin-dependent dehydrogenase
MPHLVSSALAKPEPSVSDPNTFDVIILGGGLAGGCLARQLRMEAPSLRVLVAEKRRHPVPEAAFKVGESSVEIGAHYFHSRLNLAAHLRSGHLEKLGLRYFFPDGDNRDITRRVEVGPLRFSPVPSFQLDRGRLENYLLKMNAENGVTVRDGCRVQDFELNPGGMHQVTISTEDGVTAFSARWVVDASGRAGLIKRRLGLVESSTHGANASWWRFNTRLKIDDWSEDPAWKARVSSGLRWHSTVHLMGAGYWVWLIPLGNGSHSFGIVADGDMHPFSRINRFERALNWLREFEPQCADVVERNAGHLEDFLALQHFAHSCARVFSGDRWALVGEAGVFTDPFYSPGSDFIAIGNDYVTDLIVRDTAGEAIAHVPSRSHDTAAVRWLHPSLRRPVPDYGKCAGDDREGVVGQRLLLGDQRIALFSTPILPARVHADDRTPDAPVLRAARPDAGVFPGVGSAGHGRALRQLHAQHRRRGLPEPAAGQRG